MNVFRRNDASNDPPKRRRGSSNEAARGVSSQVDVNALGQQLQRLLERLESLTPRENTRSPLQLKSSTSAYTHAGVWARLETLKRKHGALVGVPWPKALRCESDLITALMGNAELMTDTQVYIRQCEDEAASLEAQAAAALHPLASPVKVRSSNSMFSHTGGTPPLHHEQSSSSTAVSSLSRKDSESSVLRRPSYLGKVSDKVLSGTRQLRASVGDRLRSSGGSSSGGGGGAGAESDASRPPSPRERAAVPTAAAGQSPDVVQSAAANGSATAERSSRTGSNSKAENPSISPVVATPPRAAWQEEAGASQKGVRAFGSSSKKQQQQQSPEQQQQPPPQQRSRLNLSSSVGAHRYISQAYLLKEHLSM
jgi:hypothetical protein